VASHDNKSTFEESLESKFTPTRKRVLGASHFLKFSAALRLHPNVPKAHRKSTLRSKLLNIEPMRSGLEDWPAFKESILTVTDRACSGMEMPGNEIAN
jgi:hypothetical protein